MSLPCALAENAGLAFRGEDVPASARLTSTAAEKLLAARNPSGRPNSDVVRRSAGCVRGRLQVRWLVDFPPHLDDRERALYVAPFERAACSPATSRDLRNALARRDRYLAMPLAAATPAWEWFDSEILPEDTLLVVARNDDYMHGVLSARPFFVWWRRHREPDGVRAVASYPFPWPPATELNALKAAQEEHRHAIARAARSGNREAIDDAVAAAYDWAGGLTDDEVVGKLVELNQKLMHSRRPCRP